MFKKLLIATSCMLAMATGAFAEKLTQAPIDFEIYGTLNALYKSQTSWNAGAFDSKDRNDEYRLN